MSALCPGHSLQKELPYYVLPKADITRTPPSIGQHNPGLTAPWLDYSKPDNLSVTYIVYPIPGSSLRLFISVWDQTLPQVHMGGVILKATNIIASRIQSHQNNRNSVLDLSDDPFRVESEPAGIIFGVRSTNQAKRLTYGELESIIAGVWKAMYQAEKYHAASIDVQDKAVGGRKIAEGLIKRGSLTPSRSEA
ncbi:MAG: hypothetical protein Q9176_006680 [Flavoplaca citrina]